MLLVSRFTIPNKNQRKISQTVERNCAISDVAESDLSICGQELEMFAAVLPNCTA